MHSLPYVFPDDRAYPDPSTRPNVAPADRAQRGAAQLLLELVGVAGLIAYASLSLPAALGLTSVASSMTGWVFAVVALTASARCLMRAGRSTAQRPAWVLIGVGLASWSCGEILFAAAPSFLAARGGLSLADGAALAFYPTAYLTVVLLLRATVRRFSALLWLDGLAGALAVSAVVAVVAFRPVLGNIGSDLGTAVADMAYPLADLLLIAIVIFSLAMTGWRPGSALTLVTVALLLIAVADGFSLWWTSTGHSNPNTALDSLWPIGVLMIGRAADRPPITSDPEARRSGLRSLLFPIAFSITALGLLLSGLARSLNAAGYELATSALAFLVIRMVLTAVVNLQMTAASRREALTDALTGLGNRRKLMLDLEDAVDRSRASDPTTLMLFDLDGFKQYNDTFGHPAGDALLARLGRALRATVAQWGQVYRLGGDEFCVLCHKTPTNFGEVVPRTLEALSEHGQGFSVSASLGSVLIPLEAESVTHALQLADQRLYLRKGERRSGSESQQARDVLMQALRERDSGLPNHLGEVAVLARDMARRLGLGAEEIDQVTRAAELHDIGKMAIPEAILDKPAPLDSAEWALMEQHTVIGERILAAAPALRPVGELVRSSHERWDGTGYPDRLSGNDIPLGARIIAVCDAYEAMTGGRPYRPPIPPPDALAELRRCAGSQFDPEVVEAFCEELMAHRDLGGPALPAAEIEDGLPRL